MKISAHDEVSSIIAYFGAQLTDRTQPFTLLVHMKFRDGLHREVSDAWARARASTLRDKGMIAYDLNQDSQSQSRFVVYERWASLADLEAHLRTPHVTTLREILNAMLDGMPEFHLLLPTGE